MSQYEPTTFLELASHLEQAFAHHDVFYAAVHGGCTAKKAELVSFDLKEVQFLKQGTSGVYMKFDVVFDSAGNTVLARTDFVLLGHMGIYGLILGHSKTDTDTGYTSRTLVCEVSRELLCGPMRTELEKFRENTEKQERLQGRLTAQEAQAAEIGKPPFEVVIG